MIHKKIQLWEEHPEAYLTTYINEDAELLEMPPRKAMVVCPGGGYEWLSPREAEPVAKKFFAEGFNVFVLNYSVYPNAGNYVPLIELSLAITYVRENCAKYNIDPNYVFTIGFSAGGHLAASSGTLWNCDAVRKALGIEDGKRPEGINRPTGTILCYPVITAGEYAHEGSIVHVCGDAPALTQEQRDEFSLEKQVNENTCPAFIWHTFSDQLVPVNNSLLYMQALRNNSIPFEAHIFPYGPHGLSLGTIESAGSVKGRLNEHISCWFDLAIKWIRDFENIK